MIASCGNVAPDSGPCSVSGACLPGYVCQAGLCVTGQAPTTVILGIGPEGGEVSGPDGLTLTIPPDAVSTRVEIAIRAASATSQIPNVTLRSPVYSLEPSGLAFARPVTLRMPSPADVDSLRLYLGSAQAQWSAIVPQVEPGGLAVGLDFLGVVALGEEISGPVDAGLDGGVQDAGPLADAGVDAGDVDVGFPAQDVEDAGPGPDPMGDPDPDGGGQPVLDGSQPDPDGGDPDPDGGSDPDPTPEPGPDPDPDPGPDPTEDPDPLEDPPLPDAGG